MLLSYVKSFLNTKAFGNNKLAAIINLLSKFLSFPRGINPTDKLSHYMFKKLQLIADNITEIHRDFFTGKSAKLFFTYLPVNFR